MSSVSGPTMTTVYRISGRTEMHPTTYPPPDNTYLYMRWVNEAYRMLSTNVVSYLEDYAEPIRYSMTLPVHFPIDKESSFRRPPIVEPFYTDKDPSWENKIRQVVSLEKAPHVEAISFVPSPETLATEQTYFLRRWKTKPENIFEGFIQPYEGYDDMPRPGIRWKDRYEGATFLSEAEDAFLCEENPGMLREELTPVLEAFLKDPKTDMVGLSTRVWDVANTRVFMKN